MGTTSGGSAGRHRHGVRAIGAITLVTLAASLLPLGVALAEPPAQAGSPGKPETQPEAELLAQAITFTLPASAIVGESLALEGSADSGLALDYRSETPRSCSIHQAVLELKSEGTCTVSAAQAGDDRYLAATDVTASIEIVAPPPVAEPPAEPEPPGQAEERVKPEPPGQAEERVKPEPPRQAEGKAKPEPKAKPEGPSKPEGLSKPEGPAKPEPKAKPEEKARPEPPGRPEEKAKPEASGEAEAPTRPDHPAKPEAPDRSGTEPAPPGSAIEPAGSLPMLTVKPEDAAYLFYEGNAGNRSFTFEASLTSVAGGPVTFHVHTADDSATVSDGDYIAVNTDFNIPAGQIVHDLLGHGERRHESRT